MKKPTQNQVTRLAKTLFGMWVWSDGENGAQFRDSIKQEQWRKIARWHIREIEQARNHGCHKQGSAK